jgi:hypothetical protein
LKPPFPVKIKAAQKAAFVKAKADPVGKVVVMTGRVATKDMKATVAKLLTKLGYGPLKFGDNLFLKRINVRDTGTWKKSMLTGFTKRFPNLKKISMWEDRADHAAAFRAHIKSLGLEANVTHVKGGQPFAVATEGSDRDWLDLPKVKSAVLNARRPEDRAAITLVRTRKRHGIDHPKTNKAARKLADAIGKVDKPSKAALRVFNTHVSMEVRSANKRLVPGARVSLVADFPNRPWWSMPFAPAEPHQKSPAKTAKSKTPEIMPTGVPAPMDNPLPGNMNARTRGRAAGSRVGGRKKKAGPSLGGKYQRNV